jgi:Metallo-peptidase family M12B Reprolysin-like/Secretion system C-terminal sorting domain
MYLIYPKFIIMIKNVSYFALFVLLMFQSVYAQNKDVIWNKVNSSSVSTEKWVRTSMPKSFQIFELNINSLRDKLANAPHRSESKTTNGILVNLPINNKIQTFEVYDAPVLDAVLQEQLPSVKSYIGRLVDNKNTTIRFSLSLKGFNAIILNNDNGTQYIDSFSKDNKYCLLYYKRDIPTETNIVCLNTDEEGLEGFSDVNLDNFSSRNVNDGVLREFRLALACTQEYAAFHIFQLGLTSATDEVKKDAILNIMNDVMTRVNAVYENELSLTMTIIPTNKNVIFLQDSFLSNNDISALIDQSQTWIDISIGSANYDIGHMLSTSGSGLAQLFSPCTNNKARAVSGGLSSIPQGTVFENTMMHEMGHQYGAFHTYNSSSCASPATSNSAYEPGGGTTIMSYAGICGSSSNIQSEADNYFHQNSIDEMWLNLTVGNSTCAQNTATNNSAPTANAGSDFIVPISTPYRLEGVATDADGLESLTYTWEEFDLGPSVNAPNNFTSSGPIIRSFPPNTNNTRYVPRLEDYVNNVNSSTNWEKMVLVNRDINFSLVVRDNDVSGGQIDVDFMTVTVDNSGGPFSVTSQSVNNLLFTGGTTQTITWNVANTNLAPFNSNSMNILLSTDGGLTYDTLLVSNTANDGTEDVILPNINASSCRIMVESVDNIFYNINRKDFEIQENLSVEDESYVNGLSIFPNPNKGEFTITFDSIKYQNSKVKIDLYDVSGRLVYNNIFDNSNVQFNKNVNLLNMSSGVYLLNISVGDSNSSHKIIIE